MNVTTKMVRRAAREHDITISGEAMNRWLYQVRSNARWRGYNEAHEGEQLMAAKARAWEAGFYAGLMGTGRDDVIPNPYEKEAE